MGVKKIQDKLKFDMSNNILYPSDIRYYSDNETELIEIDDMSIISYDQHTGAIHSYFKDNKWRLTHTTTPRQYQLINFSRMINQNDRQLSKRLVFAILHYSKGKGGTVKAPRSISSLYEKVIYSMQEYASNKNISFISFFNNKMFIRNYIQSVVKENPSRATLTLTFLKFLIRIPENISGVHYSVDTKHLDLLRKYANNYVNSLNQSECIPPRILQNVQQMRWEHIDEIYAVLAKVEQFIDRLICEPANYHKSRGNAFGRAKRKGIHLPEILRSPTALIKELGIVEFCKKYGIKDRRTLVEYLEKLSRTSRHLVYGYTGMRNDEGISLQLGCYQDKGAGIHPVIIGIEKKNGIAKTHHFVSVREIEKVINVQEKITKTIAKYTHPEEKHLPLFFNARWIIGGVKYLESSTINPNNELYLDESKLIISEKEMTNTLMATEDRDWDNDKDFQVGKVWKFKWHQYRRSIAVYALNTGLVSLAALGKQFRHLFEATTAHYGNGHFVAEPLVGTDSKFHVKYEMDERREHYESLAMYKDMMFNLDRPESRFAPEGNENEDISPEDQILSPISPNTLAKMIKTGEASYTNTAIGSCKSIKPCDGHILLFFTGCVDCIDAEVNDDKLANTIDAVCQFKDDLEKNMPGSVELRDIQFELIALAKLQQKRKGNKNEQHCK